MAYPIGLATRFKSKRRKASRKRRVAHKTTFTIRKKRGHRKLRRGVHRPLIIWTGRKFRRPKRSKIFCHPTRINPRGYRRYRKNPLLPKLPYGLDRTLMTALPITGGVALSMLAMPQLMKYLPASITKHEKFFGGIHVILGAAAMIFVKKDIVKTLGGTMVAMGLYDLIASNVPQLKLPPIPRGGAAVAVGYDEIVGASFDSVGTDFTPAGVGSSYGSSYGDSVGDDIDYGGDSLEIG